MPDKMKAVQEWRSVKHFPVNAGGISEAYHLKRASDGSLCYAIKLKEYEEFVNEILSRLDHVQGTLDHAAPGRTIDVAKKTEDTLFCRKCGGKEVWGHNYCGQCGERLPATHT